MDAPRRNTILCFLNIWIIFIDASKCPEPRKPHVTSCSIFYNCINLPEGGYVWAPAKCPDGLVFQPYLRICVLPGDTWTCDTLATESSPTDETYEIPKSTDSVPTSYLGHDEDTLPVRASYEIDDSSDLGNVRRPATPYPLIEVLDTDGKIITDNQKPTDDPPTQTMENRMENYLYEFFNSRQKFFHPFSTTIDKKFQDNHSTWLQGFINKMLFYENIDGSSKQQTYLSSPVITRIKSPTNCQPNVDTTLKNNEYFPNFNSDVLSYIVQSYILGTRRTNGKLKKKNKKSTTTTTPEPSDEQKDEEIVSITENSVERPLDLEVDGSKGDNNILAVRGNLGGREYVTVDKYKNLSKLTRLEILEILPCAKGVRLPNRTDCTRYYTCDPTNAIVVQFSCSSRTAFNDYKRVCETQKYKNCVEKLEKASMDGGTMGDEIIETTTLATTRTTTPVKKNPCQTTGKFVDPDTDKNYYVCYSSQNKSGRIDSIIMTCPNDLIFCQDRRLCTTRNRCYD